MVRHCYVWKRQCMCLAEYLQLVKLKTSSIGQVFSLVLHICFWIQFIKCSSLFFLSASRRYAITEKELDISTCSFY